jgi:hypothetical protein
MRDRSVCIVGARGRQPVYGAGGRR